MTTEPFDRPKGLGALGGLAAPRKRNPFKDFARLLNSKESIIAAIESRIGTTNYGSWRIGLTHESVERKRYWSTEERQECTHWTQWTTASLSDAQDIEALFIRKGMKGGTGGNLVSDKTVYVYIF